MKVLGIDPALTVTGWGIILDALPKPLYISHGIIKTNPKESLEKRLKQIYIELLNAIEKFKPDQMAIEKTFVNMNGASSLLLATARGAPLLAGAMKDLPITEYTPSHVKKAVTGYGHSEKSQVYTLLKYMLKDCPENIPLDASDALAIAVTHMNKNNLIGI